MGTSSNRISEMEMLKQRISELESELQNVWQRAADSSDSVSEEGIKSVRVSEIDIKWDLGKGTCTFSDLPVAMLWVDTTLAGLMAGVQTMVGTERFALALQREGRKSVEADWEVIEKYPDFATGFRAVAEIAAVAGWGKWEIVSLDEESKTCVFRAHDTWEAKFQKSLGVSWGSNMVGGKFAGYASRLFGTNCWASQTTYCARGDAYDQFEVKPSPKTFEGEIDRLLESDEGTRADMAVALQKLQQEVQQRTQTENALKKIQQELEQRVVDRTQELARALNEKQESEEKYRSIYESAPLGIHTYDLNDNDELIFKGSNHAADTMLGVDHSPFVGMSLEAIFPPLAETEIPERYRDVCRTGTVFETEQVDYKDGRIEGCYDVRAFKTGSRTVSVMFMDITPRKRAEQERLQLTEELNRSRKMEALGLLAGGVAHDLNNILSGLVSYPELILHQLPEDSHLIQPVKTIFRAGVRASAIVQDLLTIARGAAKTKTSTDLNTIIEEYISSLEFQAYKKQMPNMEFEFRKEEELLNINASPVHLRKILMNLVTNAVEAISASGKVTVSTKNTYIDKPLRGYDHVKIGEYVRLSIVDNGTGISAANLERIFEPFFSTKRLGRSGTGLGLAVVWSSVKDHGGYIDVMSGEQGTRFDIYLPATRDKIGLSDGASASVLPRGSGQLVLVVDDEEQQRKITTEILEFLGYIVHSVASGTDAVDYFSAHRDEIALVVLDMIMPSGMSGRETYGELVKLRSNTPAVIVSGYAETEEVRIAQEMGAGSFIRKPFNMKQLARAIDKELNG